MPLNTDWDAVASTSGPLPTCDRDPNTDQSDVCPTGCNDNFETGDCVGSNTATTHYTLSTTCTTAGEDCSATVAVGTAGCCDKNIRAYYSTSISDLGEPQALTSWTTYDPRTRSWYTEEMNRAVSSPHNLSLRRWFL